MKELVAEKDARLAREDVRLAEKDVEKDLLMAEKDARLVDFRALQEYKEKSDDRKSEVMCQVYHKPISPHQVTTKHLVV
jgi:hypothetical protein